MLPTHVAGKDERTDVRAGYVSPPPLLPSAASWNSTAWLSLLASSPRILLPAKVEPMTDRRSDPPARVRLFRHTNRLHKHGMPADLR
ncbi:hypothetical protein EMIT0158MI4_130157 [Burkholderia ambifaria]